jgi:formylglycine-generating enzyme required for sulfatase activity
MKYCSILLTMCLMPLIHFGQATVETDSIQIPGTSVGFNMNLIPGGTYMMGSPETDSTAAADQMPQFEVKVDSFWIGTHEVSYEVYNIFRDKSLDLAPSDTVEWNVDAYARPSPPYEDPTFGMGRDGFPAVSMTQFAALQFCKWLSEKTGEFYRLPTEAEWEYACRAGTTTASYFGDDPSQLDAHAWHYENSDEAYHKLGEKEANPWGLYDMLGNVSEWTLDQYQKDAYQQLDSMDQVNPWIKPTKLHPRTVRGASWDNDPEDVTCTCRIESSKRWKERDPQIPKSFWWNTDSPFVGFRLVKPYNQPTPEEQAAFWGLVLGG